jgi:hypothetical protein
MVNVLVSSPESTCLQEQSYHLAKTDLTKRLDELSWLGFDKISLRLYKMYADEVLNVEEISEMVDSLIVLSSGQIIAIENEETIIRTFGYSKEAIRCIQRVAMHLDKYSQFALYFSKDFELLDMNLFVDKSSIVRLAEKIIGGGIVSNAGYLILVRHRSEVPKPDDEDNFLISQVVRGTRIIDMVFLDDMVANCDLVYSNSLGRVFAREGVMPRVLFAGVNNLKPPPVEQAP